MTPARCIICTHPGALEPTHAPLPEGWRCRDHHACRERVRALIDAHKRLAEACG